MDFGGGLFCIWFLFFGCSLCEVVVDEIWGNEFLVGGLLDEGFGFSFFCFFLGAVFVSVFGGLFREVCFIKKYFFFLVGSLGSLGSV